MSNGNEIAIVGMSGRFPQAANVEELWQILAAGRESLRAEEQDVNSAALSDQVSHMVRANSTLPNIDLFDAAFFGFNPREAEMTDPQHRLFLECAWEALENAGIQAGDRPRPIGVFGGTGMTSYVFGQIQHGAQILDAFPSIIATDKDFVTTRVSFKLNLTGPSLTVQCACSTSMVAVHLACQSLIAGECDAALAGGVAAAAPQQDTYKYMPGAMLAPDGRVRPFDAAGRGTVFADGAAVVALMRLDDAVRGGYPIRAVILGSAVNNDGGQKAGYTAPTVEGQVRVVTQALDVAGISAADLDFIEAHGTGTVLGDAIEIGALTKVLRAASPEVGICTLGSIKSNVGHMLAAAGVGGIIKAVLAMEHRAIPACANFESPNPDLDLATSPFTINTALKAWDHPKNGVRRAGVSSFGVGGTNAHVILEEAPRIASGPSRRSWQVLPLSARADSALEAVADRMRAFLADRQDVPFADSVYTAQVGRRAFENRRVVIARDAAEAVSALAANDPARVFSRKLPQQPAKIAFMFTGQGSQYPGMGGELYRDEPVFAAAVDQCLELLNPTTAADLRELVFSSGVPAADAEARLQRTETAQLALFVMHHSLAALLRSWGVRPDIMIGHSIGEYAAACLSGVLTLPDALALVALRGRLMGEMQAGAMTSVATARADLPPLPAEVTIAALNAPKLVVVAGPTAAIAAYEAELSGAGIGARRLQTSHAFHSAMMDPMLPQFTAAAAAVSFGAPQVPYVSSLTGTLVGAADVREPEFWARQIRNPVLFAQGCETLKSAKVSVVIEVGPGRGLSALARQCGLAGPDADIVTLLPDAGESALHLAGALGRLWLAGVDIDWKALHAGDERRRTALPTYPFQRLRFWIEPTLNFVTKESADKRPDERQWLYAPAWKQIPQVSSVAEAASKPEPKRVLIVGGADALVGRITPLLRARGDRVDLLTDTSPAALDQLVASWSGAADTPDRIMHLASFPPSAAAVPTDGIAGQLDQAAFWRHQDTQVLGLLRLVQTVCPVAEGKPLAIHIVSSGLFDVTGADPLIPGNAPLITFARVAAQEIPNVTCRLIDIEAGTDEVDLAERIESRLAASGPLDTVVALRRRRAWRLDFEQIDTEAACGQTPVTRDGGVYLITGGFGKVGMVFARYLAKSCRARLVLVGRSKVPGAGAASLREQVADEDMREKLAAIHLLEELGAEVMPASCDVSDPVDMARLIAAVHDRFGALNGIIHCAGVTNVGRFILDTGHSEFEQNFRSKVFGLINLHACVADRNLDFALVVSSLSAVLGGLGHMAYAAANAVADAIVLKRNQHGRGIWTTVDWDAWKFEQGRIDAVQAMLNTLDFSMNESEGAEVIALLLSMRATDQVIVSTGSLKARVKMWIEQHATLRSPAEMQSGQHKRPEVATPFAEPEGSIEKRLAAIWQEALGLDRVGRHDDFFEIGGHSLLAVTILAKTREAFGVDFPMDRVMEATRLSSAAAVIASLLGEPVEESAAAEPAPLAAPPTERRPVLIIGDDVYS